MSFFYDEYHSFICRLNSSLFVLLFIFEVLQVKETALLVGACSSVSGLVMRETHLCVVGFVMLGGCLIVWGNRIFFGLLFNLLNIRALWNTTLLKWWKSKH